MYPYGGFIAIMLAHVIGAHASPDDGILTEASDNILTETGANLLIE